MMSVPSRCRYATSATICLLSRPRGPPCSAIEAAKASAFLRDALGEDMHRTFTAIKHAEYLRVARTVSELDYHLYLHEV